MTNIKRPTGIYSEFSVDFENRKELKNFNFLQFLKNFFFFSTSLFGVMLEWRTSGGDNFKTSHRLDRRKKGVRENGKEEK